MKKIEEIILSQLSASHEFILLNMEGRIIANTNTLIDASLKKDSSIEDLALFLTVYIYEASNLKIGESIELNTVHSDLMGRDGVYDINISNVEFKGEQFLLLDLRDRTEHYEKLQKSYQEKAEIFLEQDQIIQQSEVINRQNQEIKNLLKETHHRIKNNLQVVSSLISFQAKGVREPQLKNILDEIQSRVHSIALLHEKLYRASDLKNINVKDYIQSLAKELVSNYSVGKKIELVTNIQNIKIDAKTLVPIGLLINELVANSIKHGLKHRSKGEIRIDLEETEDNKLSLTVTDDGVGIDDYSISKSPISIGGELIQLFAKQLNGTVEILDQPGAVVRIVFEKTDPLL